MAGLKAPKCAKCDGTNVKIRRQITKSGVSQFGWYCLDCTWWACNPTLWLVPGEVKALAEKHDRTLDDIDIVADYSSDTACRVCGKPGVEAHHWAPKAFREQFSDDWPLWILVHDPLCVYHHRQWHDIITPELGVQGA